MADTVRRCPSSNNQVAVLQACSTLHVVVCSTAKLAVDSIPQSFVQPAQLDEATAQRLLDQLAPGQVR